jgi:hypothetical protein
MAEQQVNATGGSQDATSIAAKTLAAGNSGWLHSAGLVGFLTVVVGLECGAVWFFLSRQGLQAADTPETAAPTQMIPAELEPTPLQETTGPSDTTEGGVEVDLGEYSITFYRMSTGTTLVVDFHLFGLVRSEDKPEFEKLWQASTHRFRDIVITIVRAVQPQDLADPSLALIKRQILEKSNRLFGKQVLQGLIVSNFSLVEQ